ncbi:MAG TPA: secretin N-terminal domain-containing protein [Verrucomicrobiae bacterium]
MKHKLLIAVMLGAFAMQRAAIAQTNVMEDDATNPPVTAVMITNTQVTVDVATNEAATNETAAEVAPAAAASPGQPADATATNATDLSEAVIPLIQFQDVPLTTAIENLARQAGINYLLDPKIGYGQPDANGQVKAEPTLSIRWENITAEHALLALLDNYGLQLVPSPQTKIVRITTKDPSAPPPLITRVVQLKYSSTSNMVDSIVAALTDKRSRVLPDTRTSQLVVVATEPEQEAVDTLVNELDKPTRQVLIETKLVEISSNPSTTKGIDWSGTLAAQNFSVGNGSTFLVQPTAAVPGTETTVNGVTTISGAQPAQPGLLSGILGNPGILANSADGLNPSTMFLNADGVHAVLSFLNSSSDAQVISTPRVVTLDNEMATISVTRAFPIINVTAGTANTSGGSSITYSNIGTILQVTPRISANDYIWLKVIPDVSSFFGTVTKTIQGAIFQADEFDVRHIDTQVLIPNANTLVMGGLVKDSPQASYTKVPFLGDIPVLGYAFRSENKSLDKDNLLIFITPTIVKDSDYTPTATDFLKSRPNVMKSPLNPHTWWDSSQPRGDWSNPAPEPGEFDKSAPNVQ